MIMTNFNKKTLLRKRKNSQIAQKQIDIIRMMDYNKKYSGIL